MMFSTKAEYGVRVMAHLAAAASEANSRDGAREAPISLGSIADAEGLPLAYLEHLVQRLRRAELVESRRGAHGGYTQGSIVRTLNDMTLADLVRPARTQKTPETEKATA
jgi:Rrf2 family protein